MIFGKTKLELKVGVFVFVGLLILTVFVLLIGNFKTWTSGYRVNIMFNFVNGVKLGAPVRFAGVDVGEVKDIRCLFSPEEAKTKVYINCWVRNDIKIPLNSTIWVNTLGLLGEKYIEIMPGNDYSQVIVHNGTITGSDPLAMNEITEVAKRIADNVDLAITKILNKEGTVGKLLYDDTIYKELEAFIQDIRKHPWKLLFKGKDKG